MVFKAGYVPKMAPLNKLGKQSRPFAKPVRNLGDPAVQTISRLYSEETMYPIAGHFECLEGLQPREFQKLRALLTNEFDLAEMQTPRFVHQVVLRVSKMPQEHLPLLQS